MVSACKNYILKDVSKVWELPRDQALQRIEDCLHLNTEYQACFRRTKEKLKESPNDKQFDFSEKYIFGKFEIFSRRLEKVKDMLLTMDRFSILAISKIEGMDAHNKQWTSVVGMAKKKNYDILDHRRQEFEVDYDDFLRAVELLQSKLQKHMETCVDRQTSVSFFFGFLLLQFLAPVIPRFHHLTLELQFYARISIRCFDFDFVKTINRYFLILSIKHVHDRA